jgi:hypothetical protein
MMPALTFMALPIPMITWYCSRISIPQTPPNQLGENKMKVSQLIELLNRHDKDADVRIFLDDAEGSITGVDEIDDDVILFANIEEEFEM